MVIYSEIFKADIIADAYSQMRISGLTVDPTPEDLELALTRLENMGAEFESRKMSAGYVLEEIPDPNSLCGVPRQFLHAYSTNLAVRLIPDFGKEVPMILFNQAKSSASNLAARSALQAQVPYPRRMPRGSGNTLRYYRWDRFYRTYGPDPSTTNKLRVGDINTYFEDWADYLGSTEDISSFTIEPDTGLEVTESAINGTRIDYTVSAPENNATAATYIDIQITTSLNRVDKRRVYFDVTK